MRNFSARICFRAKIVGPEVVPSLARPEFVVVFIFIFRNSCTECLLKNGIKIPSRFDYVLTCRGLGGIRLESDDCLLGFSR